MNPGCDQNNNLKAYWVKLCSRHFTENFNIIILTILSLKSSSGLKVPFISPFCL